MPLWLQGTLAVWGAVVATGLAGIKIWEVWRERVRLEASLTYASDDREGNRVLIHNLSKTPVQVQFWTLEWAEKPLGNDIEGTFTVAYPDDDGEDFAIPAHSSHKLYFREQDHFPVPHPKQPKSNKLYLVIHIAGEAKARWVKLWPFD